jgi:hypothetical protein
MGPEGITKLIEQQDKEVLSIREDVLKMCWYMRGGVTYEEGMNLSVSERNIVSAIIKDNLETTKKSGLPFY